MILKKPYGILIKYFKLIHVLLSFLIAFVAFNLYSLYKFFLNLSTTSVVNLKVDEVNGYFSEFLYLFTVSITVISIVIYALMRFKQKPKMYYLFLILINIVVIFLLMFSKSYMLLIVSQAADPAVSGIYRDLYLFLWLIYLSSIFFSVLRSIGFDVKKFNFKKDIADLQIQDLDSEEIELNLNIKKYELQRKLNRKKHGILNFIKTKKLLFILIFVILLIYYMYVIFMNTFVYSKVNKEGEFIKLPAYSFKVENSYFTNMSESGNLISDNYRYIVVKLNIINRFVDYKFNTSAIKLSDSKKDYFIIYNGYSLFSDIGIGYENQKLHTDSPNTYILVFKVDPNIDLDNLVLKHFDKYVKDKKVYKQIKLSPIGGNDPKNIIEYTNNKDIYINDKIINIVSSAISKNFEYNYKFCINLADCVNSTDIIKTSSGNILKLKLNNSDISSSDIEKIGYLTYDKLFEKNILVKIESITPKNAENEMYFKINSELKDATKIRLNIVTREKKYVYSIK